MHSVAFAVASLSISGGVNVILRHAMALALSGVRVALVCQEKTERSTVAWHPITALGDHPNIEWLDFNSVIGKEFDVAIATWWGTYCDLPRIRAKNYAYFVQSIESRFYPLSQPGLRNLVDSTYLAPCGFITEVRWIQDYLGRMHGHPAELALNGIDKSIFHPDGPALCPRVPGRLRVLVEGAVDVEFKNVPASIQLARDAGADEVWLLTPSDVTAFPGVDYVASRIEQNKTPEIYRSCDVLVKLSLVEGMFGPPLEMFHCGGTCLIYDVTGHDEYVKHGYNGIIVKTHDKNAVVKALRQLRQFPPLMESLKKNALETARAWPGWEESSAQFAAGLEAIISRGTVSRAALYAQAQHLVLFRRSAIDRQGAPTSGSVMNALGSASRRQHLVKILSQLSHDATLRRIVSERLSSLSRNAVIAHSTQLRTIISRRLSVAAKGYNGAAYVSRIVAYGMRIFIADPGFTRCIAKTAFIMVISRDYRRRVIEEFKKLSRA